MKHFIVPLFLIFTFSSFSQARKKANKDTRNWRYEIEGVGQGSMGTYLVKSWQYSKKPRIALEQTKKNAVHGIIFKGYPSSKGVIGQPPLARNPILDEQQKSFFDKFFGKNGRYMQFVSLTTDGTILPGDRIKIGREYKVGVVVSVQVAALRKYLESAGVIKGLSNGF